MSAGRQYCTPKEKQAILEQQKGVCGCGCGAKIADKVFGVWLISEGLKVNWEHTIANWLKAGKPDKCWLAECHKPKTKRDVGAFAKDRRLRGETTSQWNGDNRFRGRLPTGAKIESAGFRKSNTYRSVDGSLKERDGERELRKKNRADDRRALESLAALDGRRSPGEVAPRLDQGGEEGNARATEGGQSDRPLLAEMRQAPQPICDQQEKAEA